MVATTTHLQFRLILLLSLQTAWSTCKQLEVVKGFSAIPMSSVSSFQPILSDELGNFSLGFLRVNHNQLALAILHVRSSEPLWLANPTHLATWSETTQLSFNGTLLLSDAQANLVWSTATDDDGDRLLLLNTSNLQVLKDGNPIWQSFDFPTNTLVQDQNLTAQMALISSNAFYSLRMGTDFMGLYANYGSGSGSEQLYWKHTALEAKASIVEGKGSIYAQLDPHGYLAMYQTGTKPVDVQKFNTFQGPTSSFLILRVEPDGNLKGYYWDGSNSKWVLSYQAIGDTCELPNPCGSYGLCTPGVSGCSCLDNRTQYSEGEGGCMEEGAVFDLCGVQKYWVLRRKGVELAHKELMSYETASSVEECEGKCEKNCSCWGALYSNGTGYCYLVEYPIHTMVGTGDESKMGYFKVREGAGKRNARVSRGLLVTLIVAVGMMIMVGVGIGCQMRMRRRRGIILLEKEESGVAAGPYKNLGSASFRSIEMSSTQ